MTDLDSWWTRGRRLPLTVAGRRYNVFVRDEGQGSTLLLLHGFPASSYEWAQLWPALTAHHRVIALDFLGFGASDKPRRHRYRFTEQADLVEALLAELRLTTPDVVAYDYGAIVAQELLARDFPVGRVIFGNAGLFPHLYRPKRIQKLAITPVIGPLLGVAAANTAAFTRSWGAVFSREHPLRPEVAVEHFRATRAGNPARTLQSRLLAYIPERAAAADRLESALQENISRSSFLWGMQDSVSGAAIEGELRRRFTHVDIVAYHDAGHCPHLEIPERVAADVLSRTSSTGGP